MSNKVPYDDLKDYKSQSISINEKLNVVVNCNKLTLQQGEISINISNDAIESFEYIIINGIKFKKELK